MSFAALEKETLHVLMEEYKSKATTALMYIDQYEAGRERLGFCIIIS